MAFLVPIGGLVNHVPIYLTPPGGCLAGGSAYVLLVAIGGGVRFTVVFLAFVFFFFFLFFFFVFFFFFLFFFFFVSVSLLFFFVFSFFFFSVLLPSFVRPGYPGGVR